MEKITNYLKMSNKNITNFNSGTDDDDGLGSNDSNQRGAVTRSELLNVQGDGESSVEKKSYATTKTPVGD